MKFLLCLLITAVTAIASPSITYFRASSGSITPGLSSTLSWNVSNATNIYINASPSAGAMTGLPASGTLIVRPTATTFYNLIASDASGGVQSDSLTITVTAAGRTIGLEPGRQFSGNLPSGVSECAYGSYLRSLNSGFGGTCPNFIKEGDFWPTEYWQTAVSSAYEPAAANNYNVKVNSGLTGQVSFGSGQTENILNVGDPNYLGWLHGTYIPMLQTKSYLPNTKTQWGWYLWTMDGNTTNYGAIGTVINNVFTTTDVKVDPAFPQSASAWANSWAAFFKYAKDHNSPIRLAPHIGSMTAPDWTYFKTIFAYCPAVLREWSNLSDALQWSSYTKGQVYNQMTNLYWFANVATPVFPNDPPTRIVDFGININNGDVHSALAFYALMRGPNTIFSALGPTGSTAYDPRTWLATANKLGAGTSAPTTLFGSGGSSVVQRTFQGGTAYFNYGAGTRVITLPTGYTNWNGNPITSLTLANGKGDVVLRTATTTITAKAMISRATVKGSTLE
jgi:hypothetical protein